MRTFLCVILLSMVGGVPSLAEPYLQPPSPGLAKTSGEPEANPTPANQDTKHYKCGTDNAPLAAKIIAPEHTEAETERQRRDSEDKASSERWDLIFNGIAALSTALLAVIGSIQAWLFVWQLRLTKKSVDESARAADAARDAAGIASASLIETRLNTNKQLRAYVGAYDIVVENFKSGHIPKFRYSPTNKGQTPARNLSSVCAVIITDDPFNAKIRIGKLSNQTFTDLGSGQSASQQVIGPRPIEDELFKQVVEKKAFFVFAGKIVYRDVFGKRHFTIFRTYVDLDHLINGSGMLSNCPKHNSAN